METELTTPPYVGHNGRREESEKEPEQEPEINVKHLLAGLGGAVVTELVELLQIPGIPDQVMQKMEEIGLTSIEYDKGIIRYFGISNDVPATWTGEYWDLKNKLDLGSTLLGVNALGLVAGASALAIPFYAKKKPGIALAHGAIALTATIGNAIKGACWSGQKIYSKSLDQSWNLFEFATNKPGSAGTNPVMFYLDEIALGLYAAGMAGLGIKLAKDYLEKRPSEAVEEYERSALGVSEDY